MKRHLLFKAALVGALTVHLSATAAAPVIEFYKSESCGCCSEWVRHLQENGFIVKAQNVANPSDYREKFSIPKNLGSCHTGLVDGSALKGHVPAADIKRLLAERPKANGLALPSMPPGSPGMESARKDPYDVLLVKADGSYITYKHYN